MLQNGIIACLAMSETPQKQQGVSGPGAGKDSPREEFGPPSVTDLAKLTDGRKPGDYASRYPISAWLQICVELTYLLGVTAFAAAGLVVLAKTVLLGPPQVFFPELFGAYPQNRELLVWIAAGLAGACGGCASALKWLYHTVAKQQWHRDRVIWRIVVPPLSSILSVFTGLMIVSGLIPFFSKTPFTSPATGAAFGFFVGMFSDNLLASLQKLAFQIFGTLDRKADSQSEHK